ncbi:MAG: response regulator [Acholeplasma sp.]|nr:response regulator [Acholeplasma sp.]
MNKMDISINEAQIEVLAYDHLKLINDHFKLNISVLINPLLDDSFMLYEQNSKVLFVNQLKNGLDEEMFTLFENSIDAILTRKSGHVNYIDKILPILGQYEHEKTDKIDFPSVYKTKMNSYLEEVDRLKHDLSIAHDRIITLEKTLIHTQEHLLKCPITRLFLENVLLDELRLGIEKHPTKTKKNGALLIQLDQLVEINRKHGKEIGDESIRNLAYIISQSIQDDLAKLYKQEGPGIIVYFEDISEEKLSKNALTIRNALLDSIVFVEKVSVSIALLHFKELKSISDESIFSKEVIQTLRNRMRVAQKLGKSQIVDKSNAFSVKQADAVLIVDEDEMSRNMLIRIFKRIELEVVSARSVEEAMIKMKENNIFLIVSEINLSKMDGFTLKRLLNESESYAQIPFIMVSFNKTPENVKRGNLLNVDLILDKPVLPEELLGHIKRLKAKMS